MIAFDVFFHRAKLCLHILCKCHPLELPFSTLILFPPKKTRPCAGLLHDRPNQHFALLWASPSPKVISFFLYQARQPTTSSPYPVCHLNSFSSTVAPVRLGPECCTSWMCLLRLIWMRTGVFLVIRPNPMLHFAPCLSTHFFPCLNPIFKNGSFLSVVALVSVTLLDSNPRPSAEKRSNLAPTPSSSLARTTTIELPECQERRGAKTI